MKKMGKKQASFYLNGFPWLKPKLELTIIATQKAMNSTRNATSLHFLLCFMISLCPFPIPPFTSLDDGYFPITGPNGPLISLYSLCMSISAAATTLERERKKQLGLFVCVCVCVRAQGESVGNSGGERSKSECERDKSKDSNKGF